MLGPVVWAPAVPSAAVTHRSSSRARIAACCVCLQDAAFCANLKNAQFIATVYDQQYFNWLTEGGKRLTEAAAAAAAAAADERS